MLKCKKLFLFLAFIALIMSGQVKAEKIVYSSNINAGKKIALTFDDGPHPRYTPEILGILDEYSIKATFFVIGINVKNYPNQFKMVLENGHEVGNHTYSHKVLKNIPSNEVEKEITDTENQISELTEYKISLLRPPCGLYDEALKKIAEEKQSKIVLWAIDTLDWAHTSTDKMVKNVVKNVKDGDIILFHDYVSGEYNTPEALRVIIPILLEKGYEFVTVSELLQ